jgi:hypothetical protein
MFIYHRNVSVSIVVAIIRKHNNDSLTNNIYSFFLKYIHINTDKHTDRQTDTHTFAFIYKKMFDSNHGNQVVFIYVGCNHGNQVVYCSKFC